MSSYRPPAGGGGGAPTGPAGGVLGGTYPNPAFAVPQATTAALNAAIAALSTVYQPLAAVLTSLVANGTPSAFGLAWLLAIDAAAGRTSLGLGTAATANTGAFDAAGAAAAAQAAAQAASQPLAAILTSIVANGAPGAEGLALLLTSTVAAARTNLGLGTAALVNTGTGAGDVPTTASADTRYAPFTPTTAAGLGTTGTVNLDLSTLNQTVQSIGQTGALTFTTSNLVAGRMVQLIVKNTTGGALSITYPAWIVVGTALPTSLAAGKTLVFTLEVPNGVTTDAASIAAGAVQP